MFFSSQMSLSRFGHTPTVTSPRCALWSSSIWVRDWPMPQWLQSGRAEISAALVKPETDQARVRFANEGLADDGWLPLGAVEIV